MDDESPLRVRKLALRGARAALLALGLAQEAIPALVRAQRLDPHGPAASCDPDGGSRHDRQGRNEP